MTGIEVLRRFSTVEWHRYRPLDAAFYAACRTLKGMLDELIVRSGARCPFFFLDSTVIGSRCADARIRKELQFFDDKPNVSALADILGEDACTLMMYQDCDNICRYQLVPLKVRRSANAFTLANG